MLVSRNSVAQYLNEFLSEEDKKDIILITDLSWMTTIVHEIAFHCRKDLQEKAKANFFGLLEKLSDAMGKIENLQTSIDSDYIAFFHTDKRPALEDLVIVLDLFYKLTIQEKRKIQKDKLLIWLKGAWDTGFHQKRVYDMEIEGSIMNEFGVIANFAADVALWGASKGLLPK